ncbi:RNA polymerase sigma factor [Actinomadura logoneensis]|uniref:RNA polymerase sigma factor n=1 Tax=Actinomadura logoneensis TaxID=2293572 RepID=A0A372JW86_9ACTN|nr:RNA polymerase sigma factor [Actinomadura logoneensis]RFU43608.1 RNA polymerase sigma factor [Actinomadura logoneensis]
MSPRPSRPSSFPEFYEAEIKRLTAYLRAQTSDGRWVEDIAQESLIAAADKWDELMTYDRPDAWLFKVATRMLRRNQAKAREQCTSLDELGERAGPELGQPGLLDLHTAVRRLPRRQREAVYLHCVLRYSLEEAAAILAISESSVKTHVRRARQRLAELLADDGSPRPGRSTTRVRRTR